MSKIHEDLYEPLEDPDINKKYIEDVNSPDELPPGEEIVYCLVRSNPWPGQLWRRENNQWAPSKEPTLYDRMREIRNPFAKRVEELMRIAEFLWQLLDNIDTLDDSCKDNDHAFRVQARAQQQRRWEVGTSDGYSITLREGGKPQRCGEEST